MPAGSRRGSGHRPADGVGRMATPPRQPGQARRPARARSAQAPAARRRSSRSSITATEPGVLDRSSGLGHRRRDGHRPLRLGLERVGGRRDGHRLPAGAGDGVDLGNRCGVGVRGLAGLRRPALGGRRRRGDRPRLARGGGGARCGAGGIGGRPACVRGERGLTTCGARRRTASCPLHLGGPAQPGEVEGQHGHGDQDGPPGQDAEEGERGDEDQQRQGGEE